MRSTAVSSLPNHYSREFLAGAAGAMTYLAVVLTLGMLSFAAIGPGGIMLGMPAAFTCFALGAGTYALIARSPMPTGGPSSSTTLIMASLVAQLALSDHADMSDPARLAGLVALVALSVLLSGVIQIGFALAGLARLARMVPQPVLAGFMNGAALLLIVAQVPMLLGLPLGTRLADADLGAFQPAALAIGGGAAVAVWLLARRWPRLPATLIVLLAASLLLALWPRAEGLGAVVGPLPTNLVWPPAIAPLLDAQALLWLRGHGLAVLYTAFVLAIIGALETSLNVLVIDQQLNTRSDPRRELLALGMGNLVSGFFGGLPLVANRTRAVATLAAGGQGAAAALAGCLSLGLLFLIGGPWLATLSLPVLSGIMLVIAFALIDRWTGGLIARLWRGPRTQDLVLGLAVVLLVCGVTLGIGLGAAVVIGILLSLVVFAMRMQRSLLRAFYRGHERPSRRIYPEAIELRLAAQRSAITVFELEGALFFGSGEGLLQQVDRLDPDCRCLVLDMRHVGTIDETGATTLLQLAHRLRRRSTELLLAGLADDSPQASALIDLGVHAERWPDVDRAIEAAEARLLGGAVDFAHFDVPLAQSSLLRGLDVVQQGRVAVRFRRRELERGAPLFAQGDAADGLFVLERGSLSVFSATGADGRNQRYLSLSPGMMLGETAMLDRGSRSADACADTPVVVHELSLADLDELQRHDPAVAALLYRNISAHLSQRLRHAAGAWPGRGR